MQRRAFLEWTINGLGALCGAVLGIPAVAYLIDARNRPTRETDFRTVARFGELPVSVPTEFVIRETRRDAWNLYPDDIVGRVWLIRHPDDSVTAFTTICPHLGCSVNWLPPALGTADEGKFLCPCHGGKFKKDGVRIDEPGSPNPAPRGMDTLEVRLEPDPDDEMQKVVKVKFLRFKTLQDKKEVDG